MKDAELQLQIAKLKAKKKIELEKLKHKNIMEEISFLHACDIKEYVRK